MRQKGRCHGPLAPGECNAGLRPEWEGDSKAGLRAALQLLKIKLHVLQVRGDGGSHYRRLCVSEAGTFAELRTAHVNAGLDRIMF